MDKKLKKRLYRILIALVVFVVLMVLMHATTFSDLPYPLLAVIFLVPYLFIGFDVLKKAAKNIRNGQVFDENFLMMIATIAAFVTGEFSEALAVMLFYQTGELFQDYAVGRSRASITEMMSIAPEYANRLMDDGTTETIDPDDAQVGDILIIKPGEKVPLDGVVVEGESFLDTAALTGESVPRRITVGDEIISGCINNESILRIRVTKPYEDSTVSRILELVENASTKKARLENFITRFAKYYTPVVTIGAVLLALIPPIILTLTAGSADWISWIHRACVFLIVSCPCALVISVPLGFFGGIGAASRIGVLVKGSNYLEAVAEMDRIVFDKTGTLTKGEFKVSEVHGLDNYAEDILRIAAHLESMSTHPIAVSVVEAYGKPIDSGTISDITETAGRGISGTFEGHRVHVGSTKLLEANGIAAEPAKSGGTVVYVGIDNAYAGYIVISDRIKDGAKKAISSMRAAGIRQTVMLTGDRRQAAEDVGGQLGIDRIFSELLPADKVEKVESILSENGGMVGFVGDGINDAPVLMRADVGFAMGSMGSDAAIEAADIVLMDDDIRKIASVIRIARKTLGIVKANVVFAIGVKLIVLVLGALGIAGMWAAVFADVGVAVLAILNSMRLLSGSKR